MRRLATMLFPLLALCALFSAHWAYADEARSALVEPPAKSSMPVTLKAALGTVPSVEVRLRELDATVIATVRQSNSGTRTKALQIGVEREVGGAAEADSATLLWHDVAGGAVAHWHVTSSGASALRVGLAMRTMATGVEIRFTGSDGVTVYGPFSVADVRGQSPYWSPVVQGDTAVVELFVPDSVGRPDIAIARLSHLFLDPVSPDVEKMLKDGSGSCNIDLVCRSSADASLGVTARSVAKMVFQKDGKSFLCTGTLLNPADNSRIPYFYSANHCISTQAVAGTLTTHWFYDRTGCGVGTTSSSYVQTSGGATLLYANEASDASFMRLNASPPAGAIRSGWNSVSLAVGTDLTAVHHPRGDWTKVSLGSLGNLVTLSDPGGSFLKLLWTSGVTEGGSSGSGIFTFANGEYALRGGLFAGASACDAPASDMYDYYSRLDQVYPQIRSYLNPAAVVTPLVVEFYNTILDNFFITANANEAAAVDGGGAGPGWLRTGYTFKSGGLTQVCRFYGSQSPGPNSHFYTADASECNSLRLLQQQTPASQQRWNFESFDFATTTTVAGGCAAGTVPVYRAYNNGPARGVDSNHRITSSLASINAVVAKGWISEGVRMCAPL
jgi:lysyl endopeptidase